MPLNSAEPSQAANGSFINYTAKNPMSQESLDQKPENTPAAAAADAKPAPETMPSTEELLRKAELDAQEHHDAWLRAKAETENMRKRAVTDVANAHKYAVENFAAGLLAVKDSLEAALGAETATIDTLQSGAELTLKQLSAAFAKFNLVEMNPVGEKFDPHRHQAISMVASEAAPNTVVQVLQKGYALHDRVIRPALVMVSKAPDA